MAIYVQSTVTAAATAASTAGSWVPLNRHQTPFSVGIGLRLEPAQGHLDARVQYTFDNVFDPTVSANVWNSTVSAQATATPKQIDGSFVYPITAVRVAIVSGSGTAGEVRATLYVIQGD